MILDLQSGNYMGLSDQLAPHWVRLMHLEDHDGAHFTRSTTSSSTSEEVDSSTSSDDAIKALMQSGLLIAKAPGARRSTSPVHEDALALSRRKMPVLPSVIGAFLSIWDTWRLIRRSGMKRLHEVMRREGRCPLPTPTRRSEDIVSAFLRAEPLTPLAFAQDDCLLRSVALWCLLRRHGHKARHVIGVRVHPFAAHAWTEVDGTPVLDASGDVSQFSPILMTP